MRTALIFILGVIAGLVLTYGLCATGNLPFECAPDGSIVVVDSTGNVTPIDTTINDVVIDQQTAQQYADANSTRDCSIEIAGCKGGTIEIATLANLISQVDAGKTHIYYRFGYTDTQFEGSAAMPTEPNPHVILMLSAGKFNEGKQIIANGNTRESFCPFSCD